LKSTIATNVEETTIALIVVLRISIVIHVITTVIFAKNLAISESVARLNENVTKRRMRKGTSKCISKITIPRFLAIVMMTLERILLT